MSGLPKLFGSMGDYSREEYIGDVRCLGEILDQHVPKPALGTPFRMQIRPGFYELEESLSANSLKTLRPMEIESDELFETQWNKVINSEVKQFWKSRQRMDEMGYIHKTGLLLTGSPGCGKTSLLKMEMSKLAESGAVIFLSRNPYVIQRSLATFRAIEPERDVVVCLEDIDEHIKYGGVHSLLETMDGLNSVNHVMFIATTNNQESIPSKLMRTGRIDRKLTIPMPNVRERLRYLENKQQFPRKVAEEVSVYTEGFGYSDLKALVQFHKGYNISLKQAIRTIKEDIKSRRKNESKRMDVGHDIGCSSDY